MSESDHMPPLPMTEQQVLVEKCAAIAARLAVVEEDRDRLREALRNIALEAHQRPFRRLEIAGDIANDALRQSEEKP